MKPYKLSKIYSSDGDLKKDWYVYYYYLNPITNKFHRFRIKNNLNRIRSLSERQERAEQIKVELDYKLIKGFNPFAQSVPKHEGEQNLIQNLDEAVELKKAFTRKRSYQSYFQIVKAFKSWLIQRKLGEIKSSQISEAIILKFLDHVKTNRNVSNKTRNNYLMFLKALFNLLIERGMLAENPCKRIRRFPVEMGRNIAFSDDQKRRIIEYLEQKDQYLLLFVKFIYYCFLRPAELRRLKVQDFDLKAYKIIVAPHVSKNKKLGVINIPAPFWSTVDSMNLSSFPPNYFVFSKLKQPAEFHIGHNYFTLRHLQVLRKLQISPNHTLYSWKHTGVVRAFEAGIHIKDLQNHLRHSSLDMVNKYLKSLGLETSENLKNNFPQIA